MSLFAIALALSGCVAAEPPTDATVSSSTWLTITDDGVGTIHKGTPFQESALATVAPGAEIRPIQTAKESTTVWTQAAFVGDVQAVQFFKGPGNTVGEIHGVAQHLSGPNGERIGMTFAQARVNRGSCRPGKSLWVGMAICKARGASHVELVFSIPDFDGPFDRLPSGEVLNEAELQRIVWRAT
ncbi:DUF1131 family protein [Acuticoccus sp. M5D2P5]|uniref:DUF1131 family protein n=1 Tax=Acuticoccus kalidii TaxID=2910977 RepID=UPI001F3B371B|nr:DUF1131 family protein [Acuticoccus kalidii]MCF3935577.1 DUF1131 family protein [Acuticoccus kalidii]